MFFQQTRSRKFILFGDIFQKDPEIYGNIYEKLFKKNFKNLYTCITTKQLVESIRIKYLTIYRKHKWAIHFLMVMIYLKLFFRNKIHREYLFVFLSLK